jgi:hypothetical protein
VPLAFVTEVEAAGQAGDAAEQDEDEFPATTTAGQADA